MFNLYRVSFFILALWAIPLLSVQSTDPFINTVYEVVDKGFDDPYIGIPCGCLNRPAHALWETAQKEGVVLVNDKTDRETRAWFGQIQFHAERAMLDELKQSAGKAKAIWIIHTPLIPTPLVTEGEASPTLVDPKILNDGDKTRATTALNRTTVMREFLAHGGILVAVYDKSAPVKRTKEQQAVFDALKKHYPHQLIDFPIESVPSDKIGATYFFQDAKGSIFQMTNLGVQIHDQKDFATWGVWLHDHAHPKPVVTERIQTVMRFLRQANFNENLLPPTHVSLLAKD